MKKFRLFLRGESGLLLGGLCVLLCFFAVYLLYDLPAEPLIYALLLSVTFQCVLLAAKWIRQSRRCRRLRELSEQALIARLEIPEPTTRVEDAYRELVCTLCTRLRRQQTEDDRRVSDLKEYFTLWAHQIKTPIAAMKLLLQSEEPAGSAMKDELFRVGQYVEMALAYLRLDDGAHDLVIVEQPLDPIIRSAVRPFAGQFIRSRLSLRYEPVSCTVLTDAKALAFVLGQLLSNALKYTMHGEVTITLEAPATLVIHDTGIGIAPEDLPRVFEKGFTGYNGHSDRTSTGIGLYLCRRVCGLLGHRISMTSEVGTGTTVRLELDYVQMTHE